MALRTRPASRWLVLDPQGRVLLFRFVHKRGALAGQDFWATPGGGLEPDETFETAAVRELKEETGIVVAKAGAEVMRRKDTVQLPDGEHVLVDERYFVVRVEGLDLDRAGWTQQEREVMADLKWWSVAELDATAQTVWPQGLARELARVLRSF